MRFLFKNNKLNSSITHWSTLGGLRCIVTSCRAVVLPRFGGPEVMELRDDVSVPNLNPNEVLVRARAVSVNPLDTRVCF